MGDGFALAAPRWALISGGAVEHVGSAFSPIVLAGRWLQSAVLLALLMAGCADDPRPQILERVHMRTQSEVVFTYGVKWSLGDKGDCTTFALHNLKALRSRGIDAAAWVVWDDRGQAHAVVVSGDQVLDSHYRRLKTREALEKIGYRFRFPLPDTLVADLVRRCNPGTATARS